MIVSYDAISIIPLVCTQLITIFLLFSPCFSCIFRVQKKSKVTSDHDLTELIASLAGLCYDIYDYLWGEPELTDGSNEFPTKSFPYFTRHIFFFEKKNSNSEFNISFSSTTIVGSPSLLHPIQLDSLVAAAAAFCFWFPFQSLDSLLFMDCVWSVWGPASSRCCYSF